MLNIPRYHACILVDEITLNAVLDGSPPEAFDGFGLGRVELISKFEAEGYTAVGLSYLVPRVYCLLAGPGWHNFAVEDDGACP